MNNLIIFEGPDGTGKSSLAKLLVAKLKLIHGENAAVYWAFPGRKPGTLGEYVYQFHHNEALAKVTCPESVQLMHVAAHIDNMRNHIIPMLEDGKIVVLDRCYWSTWVYGLYDGVNPAFLSRAINLELPYWGDWGDMATMLLVTRTEPFYKGDDYNFSMDRWLKLTEYYERIFNYNGFDNFERRLINNDSTLEAALTRVEDFIKL